MDLDLVAAVKQYSAGLLKDGERGRLRMSRDGALQINDREALVDMWTRDGRVFVANNPVIGQPETMSAAGTAITLTAPSIRFTVPVGGLVVPIHVKLKTATVIAKSDIFGVLATASDSYTSGGDAVLMTPYNAIVQPDTATLRPVGVEKLHYSDTAIVEGSLVRPRLLKQEKRQGQAAELDTTFNPEYNILKGDPMVYMEGPASFLVFHVQETTAAEDEWSMSWAVLEPGTVGK